MDVQIALHLPLAVALLLPRLLPLSHDRISLRELARLLCDFDARRHRHARTPPLSRQRGHRHHSAPSPTTVITDEAKFDQFLDDTTLHEWRENTSLTT